MNETRLSQNEYIGKGHHVRVSPRETRTFPLHGHNYFEIEFILGGEGTHFLNGKPHPVGRGALFLMTPSDFHQFEIKTAGEAWNIAFDEAFLSAGQVAALLGGGFSMTAEEPLTQKIEAAVKLLFAEQGNEEASALLLSYLLSLLLKPTAVGGTDAVSHAVAYLDLHFKDSPSQTETANAVGLSPSYFGELFRKTLGVTYLTYLTERKLRSAALLLRNGVAVSEAAFSSGFGSLSGFLYAFKKKYGLSPCDYRRGHRKLGR